MKAAPGDLGWRSVDPLPASLVADLAPAGLLRASINLGNPVLAGGTPEEPTGVSVDVAREIAARLDLETRLVCFDAARKSYEALHTGIADIGFLAIEPEREVELAFTAPYVLIEGVYVVPEGAAVASPVDVDRPGVRVGVKRGSAYDLFLSRSLVAAEVVRGEEGVTVYADAGLDVGAGIRQPATAWAQAHPGHRVLEPAFMQIRQAVATTRERDAASIAFLRGVVDELKASGFVADALARSGRGDVAVAPTT
jgi:polar amino acid transport system substrate-binding protein